MGSRSAGARERRLRRRQWWRFGRHQNLDKQEIEKLIVSQTVPSLRLCADAEAAFYINNVRVNGISPAHGVSLWYLLGVMNAPVADFVFRRIAAPKGGGYFEANKQFIAPLPIPDAPEADRADIAARAERLRGLHSERRDLLAEIGRRMSVVAVRARPDDWLFPDLPALARLDGMAPAHLDRAERRAWAKKEREGELNGWLNRLGESLRPGMSMDARFEEGELRFFIGGVAKVVEIPVRRAPGR